MTLVAAFAINGIPALIGDFLLTDNQPHAKHIFLPTRPALSGTKPETGRRRICGLRKKIHKVGERLIVGFTGDLKAGEQLLKGLYSHVGDSSPTLIDLEQFLANVRFTNKDKTELVGWIWERRPLCFQWKGSEPEEIKVVDSVFSGSGGGHFRNAIMTAGTSGMSPELKTALDKAIYVCVAKAGKILFSELMAAGNLAHDYGFGAELMLWDGGRFFYIDKLAYAFWNIVVNGDNSLTVCPSNVSAIYKNCGTFSVMQVSECGPKTGMLSGLEAKHTYVHMITPINDDMPTFDVRSVGRQSYDTPLWFSGIVVSNPKKSKRVECTIVSECTEKNESFTSHKHGVLYLNLGQLSAMLPREIFN